MSDPHCSILTLVTLNKYTTSTTHSLEVGKNPWWRASMMLVEKHLCEGAPYAFVPIITTYSIICEYNLLERIWSTITQGERDRGGGGGGRGGGGGEMRSLGEKGQAFLRSRRDRRGIFFNEVQFCRVLFCIMPPFPHPIPSLLDGSVEMINRF